MRDILILLEECKKLESESDCQFSPNNMPQTGIIMKGLISAIIIHYFRCFPGSKGRKYLLQENKIPKNHIDAHNLLKELRNKSIAHSEGVFEECTLAYLIPPYKRIKRGKAGLAALNSELHQLFNFSGLLDDIQSLVKILHTNITSKIDSLGSQIREELKSIPEERIYKFLKGKAGNRVELYQNDVDKLKT